MGDRPELGQVADSETGEAELSGVCPDAWDALARGAVQPNPFLERFALIPFARLGPGALRLFCAYRDGRLIGLTVLTPTRGYVRLPIRHLATWLHPHLFDATPMVLEGHEDAFARDFLAWLDAQDGRRFARLTRVRQGAVSDALQAVSAAQGRRADVVETLARPFLPLTDYADFETFLAEAVGAKTRKTLRRRQRALAREGAIQLRTIAPSEDAVPWLAAFADAEHRGWKGRAGTSLLSRPDEHDAFLRMTVAAHAMGRLVAAQLRVDGRPIAHTIDIGAGSGLFTLKTAFDPQWSDFAPGVLIEAAMIERGIKAAHDGGPRWLDSCAGADHDVLRRLWPTTRPLVQMLIERRGGVNKATYGLARSLERAAQRRKG